VRSDSMGRDKWAREALGVVSDHVSHHTRLRMLPMLERLGLYGPAGFAGMSLDDNGASSRPEIMGCPSRYFRVEWRTRPLEQGFRSHGAPDQASDESEEKSSASHSQKPGRHGQ